LEKTYTNSKSRKSASITVFKDILEMFVAAKKKKALQMAL